MEKQKSPAILANESNVHSHTIGDSAEDIQVWDDDLEIKMLR